MNTPSRDESWHLDKKVPLALIGFLVVQFAVVVMFVMSVSSQGAQNDRRLTVLEGQKYSERLSAIEAQMPLLLRMEQKIDRISEVIRR